MSDPTKIIRGLKLAHWWGSNYDVRDVVIPKIDEALEKYK